VALLVRGLHRTMIFKVVQKKNYIYMVLY